MVPLSMIPTPYRLMALAVAFLFACLGSYVVGRSHGGDAIQAKWDKAKAVQLQAALNAEQAVRAKEQSMNQKVQEAQNAAIEREKKLRADYAAAHAVALGLRDTVAALRGELAAASPEACRVTADTALAVFGECADRYQRVAEAADRHASDVETLSDAWPE